MKKIMTQGMMATGALILFASAQPAHAHGVTMAKAAELSLHRVERLVILHKIEDAFQSKPKSIKVSVIAHQAEEDPSFKATISQYPGADGTQKSVDIILNEEGKAISFTVNAGADAANAPIWPDKDATTLSENSLHYVLDNATTKPELAPYNEGLTQLSIAPGTNAAGAAVAVCDFKATPTAPILRVRMKLDGTLDSTEIVNRTE